jgi:hypothetical protein
MRVLENNYGWNPIETAPLDKDVTLEVTDGRGAPYRLANPGRRTASGWVSSSKGTPLAVTPEAVPCEAIEAMPSRPLPRALARRQDHRRLCRPRRQRSGARARLLPGRRSRGAAGQGPDEGRGPADRRQHRAAAGAAWLSARRECARWAVQIAIESSGYGQQSQLSCTSRLVRLAAVNGDSGAGQRAASHALPNPDFWEAVGT